MIKNVKDKISNEGKTIIENLLSLSTLEAANYILPLVTLQYLVRTLGTENFGLVMFAQALIMLFKMAVDFGFIISGTREISLSRDNSSVMAQIFSAIVTTKVILLVIGAFILFFVIELVDKFSVDREVYYYSYGIVIGHSLFPNWFFQGIEKMKFITLINVLAKVIFTICIFVFIKEKSQYVLVPIFNSLGFIVAGLLGLLISLKYVEITSPRYKDIKRLIIESFSLFVAKFASNLYTSCNVLILGFFVDNSIVGIYSSIEKLILAIKNMFGPIYSSIFPWLVKQNEAKKITTIKKLQLPIFILGLLVVVVVFIFGDFILEFIYDDDLISKYSYVFKILSFIGIFAGLNMLFSNLFFTAIKKYNLRMNVFIFTGIFSLILSFCLVPQIGIKGSAISAASSELFLLVVCYYYYKKLIKTD